MSLLSRDGNSPYHVSHGQNLPSLVATFEMTSCTQLTHCKLPLVPFAAICQLTRAHSLTRARQVHLYLNVQV